MARKVRVTRIWSDTDEVGTQEFLPNDYHEVLALSIFDELYPQDSVRIETVEVELNKMGVCKALNNIAMLLRFTREE